MTTFIQTKFKKSDDQTNIYKHKVAANITEYHIISKLIFLTIIIQKFTVKINMIKWTYGHFGHNYRVAALSTLYITVLVFIITSLKSIGQF